MFGDTKTVYLLPPSNLSDIMLVLMDEITLSYIVFSLAVIPLVLYLVQMLFFVISIYVSRRVLHHPLPLPPMETVPGVSILKPLMGIDPRLELNLESHFKLDYAGPLELLLCVQDSSDPAIDLVNSMRERFPHVDCRLFIGGKDGVINPMVHNMAPGYENAKYDNIWVSTSRICASTEIINDMVARIQEPEVAVVHQLPFFLDRPGLAAAVEKIYFGCSMARNYLSLNQLGACCMTGMSYLIRKKYLDEIGGLAYFGKYLAEDFFLSSSLHSKGYHLRVCAIPAQQNVSCTIVGYKDRMVRWLRLRLNMMTFVAAFLEPLVECIPLGIYFSWSLFYIFDCNPYLVFPIHFVFWCFLDYLVLSGVQRHALPFSKCTFVLAWLIRECLVPLIYFEALLNPRRITWGRNTYRVTLGGHTTLVTRKGSVLPI